MAGVEEIAIRTEKGDKSCTKKPDKSDWMGVGEAEGSGMFRDGTRHLGRSRPSEATVLNVIVSLSAGIRQLLFPQPLQRRVPERDGSVSFSPLPPPPSACSLPSLSSSWLSFSPPPHFLSSTLAFLSCKTRSLTHRL
ncbi:hypothetical protein Q8A67_024127 [Cirrhinus molitorella]|uniref:Uncharacterized protein n=1 Tax=Cirrhinus molitorella TaxID=172907 RepID=A0AA88TJW3_9TELE|nr:hypothetical protein Q8A67_024127 [Cirrhinus molitorella]